MPTLVKRLGREGLGYSEGEGMDGRVWRTTLKQILEICGRIIVGVNSPALTLGKNEYAVVRRQGKTSVCVQS